MEPAPKLPPKPIREQARVLYPYEAQNDDELTIREGDIITIIAKEIEDQGWYKGELNGKIGVFPDNFVECYRPSFDRPPPPKGPPPPPSGPPPAPTNTPSSSVSTGKILSKTSHSATDGNVSSSTTNTPAAKPSDTSILRNSGIFGLPKKVTKAALIAGGSSSSVKAASSKPHLTHSVSVDSDHSDHSNNNNNNNTSNNNDCSSFSGIESGVKLSHPTANRPKGPSNRRPPSYIASPSSTSVGKEDGDGSVENGDSVSSAATNGTSTSNGSIHATSGQSKASSIACNATTGAATIEPASGASNSVTSPGNKSNKEDPPAWMVELRKTQELKRTKTIDSSSPVATERSITSSLDTESSNNFALPPRASHRASGDFTARLNSFTASPSTGANISTAPSNESTSSNAATVSSSILKPAKPVKPSTTVTTSNASSPTSGSTAAPFIAREISATNSSSSSGTNNVSKVTGTNNSSTADILNSPLVMDLQRELKHIKETYVPKKEFDELTQQVAQLKEQFETQSKSKSKTIKELINDLAEERKKISALQIEVDRLRKLNAA